MELHPGIEVPEPLDDLRVDDLQEPHHSEARMFEQVAMKQPPT